MMILIRLHNLLESYILTLIQKPVTSIVMFYLHNVFVQNNGAI